MNEKSQAGGVYGGGGSEVRAGLGFGIGCRSYGLYSFAFEGEEPRGECDALSERKFSLRVLIGLHRSDPLCGGGGGEREGVGGSRKRGRSGGGRGG